MSIADTQAQAEQLLQRAGILPVVTEKGARGIYRFKR